MKILFYDSEYTGHHSEFIMHLVKCLNQSLGDNLSVHFLLPSYFASKTIVDFGPNISAHFLKDDELDVKQSRWDLVIRSKQEVRNILKYGRKLEVDKVFCFNLNPILLTNSIVKVDFPFSVSGIYFHPFNRLQSLKHGSLIDRIRYKQKFFFAKRLLANNQVRDIYVLNDAMGVKELNKICKTDKFKWLPDPININASRNNITLARERSVFLFFGYINRRKGIISFLQGVKTIDYCLLERMEIRIMGHVDPTIKDELEVLIDELKETPVLINVKREFLSNEELIKEVSNCAVVLMPYLRVEGSSGLLGWAAVFKKPVLGPSQGLIGELIREYKLGVTIECSHAEYVRVGVLKILHGDFNVNSVLQEKYCIERLPEKFSQIIIDSIKVSK